MNALDRPLVLIDAPSNLGLRPPSPGMEPGCKAAPAALRRWNLRERLGAREGGRLQPPPYDPTWHPGYGVRNGEAIRDYAMTLAARIGESIDAAEFPVVLGGDCSILLGNTLALRRRGRFGLIFLDGHLDFRHPGNAPAVGAAAGEDLALVTGRGGERLTGIDGLAPYVRDGDVIAIGEREGDENGNDILDTEITVWNLAAVRHIGLDRAARLAVERMRDGGVDGYWIHLDVDVLSNDVMPAVDSPQPDGLSYGELATLLAPILDSELAAGLEITIFDPDLDPDGSIARDLVDGLVALFHRARIESSRLAS
ncbi:MAG: arginase family protein [Thermomicrobiales bacterium]|nr:arginase family protein [Thermomicrobiales bacterium]